MKGLRWGREDKGNGNGRTERRGRGKFAINHFLGVQKKTSTPFPGVPILSFSFAYPSKKIDSYFFLVKLETF